LEEYKEAYASAPNDIKKSGLFNGARTYEAGFFKERKNTIAAWKGWIDDISTSKGGGSLRLRVKIGDAGFGGFKVSFETGYEMDENGIPSGSPVYAAVADLKEKDCVIFSGRVKPREKSISESGAMSGPEYSLSFTSVSPCDR
jgi:hypothetical protein